jgi:hypothetical protein
VTTQQTIPLAGVKLALMAAKLRPLQQRSNGFAGCVHTPAHGSKSIVTVTPHAPAKKRVL